jgi:hypothetical protein
LLPDTPKQGSQRARIQKSLQNAYFPKRTILQIDATGQEIEDRTGA